MGSATIQRCKKSFLQRCKVDISVGDIPASQLSFRKSAASNGRVFVNLETICETMSEIISKIHKLTKNRLWSVQLENFSISNREYLFWHDFKNRLKIDKC